MYGRRRGRFRPYRRRFGSGSLVHREEGVGISTWVGPVAVISARTFINGRVMHGSLDLALVERDLEIGFLFFPSGFLRLHVQQALPVGNRDLVVVGMDL